MIYLEIWLHLISLHRTKKGAEIAMEFHKEEKRKEMVNEVKVQD